MKDSWQEELKVHVLANILLPAPTRPSAKHTMAAVSLKPGLEGHSALCSWVCSRVPTATRARSCHLRTWSDECIWFPRTRRCRTASLRHIGRVEMDTGKSPRCGTGSTGKPSGAAQVGEWAEADPDGLTSVFCLGYTKHIPLVSWEGHLLPY